MQLLGHILVMPFMLFDTFIEYLRVNPTGRCTQNAFVRTLSLKLMKKKIAEEVDY